VYDLSELLNGIGGLLGMMLGISAVSISQMFLELIENKFYSD